MFHLELTPCRGLLWIIWPLNPGRRTGQALRARGCPMSTPQGRPNVGIPRRQRLLAPSVCGEASGWGVAIPPPRRRRVCVGIGQRYCSRLEASPVAPAASDAEEWLLPPWCLTSLVIVRAETNGYSVVALWWLVWLRGSWPGFVEPAPLVYGFATHKRSESGSALTVWGVPSPPKLYQQRAGGSCGIPESAIHGWIKSFIKY